ncbi:MAG: 3D domain-containing protein [Planctomycetota bacterium]
MKSGFLGILLLVLVLIGVGATGDRPDSVRVVRMTVTAYCPCTTCCGEHADGITASGKPVTHNAGRFVAADTEHFPMGTMLRVPGYAGDDPVPVLDRGGAIKGTKLDVFFPDHETAKAWGVKSLRVEVWE